MLLGSLREQLLYPLGDRNIGDEELRAVLSRVNLADLPERVGGFDAELDWGHLLSLGEQQRLAFARLLLAKPGYAFLDEATSALDEANEARLYERCGRRERPTSAWGTGRACGPITPGCWNSREGELAPKGCLRERQTVLWIPFRLPLSVISRMLLVAHPI